MINSASIINVSFLNMKEEVDQLVAGGTTFFHIDLMDGHYVPNLCLPIKMLAELKAAYPQITMDVHLMVTNPEDYVERLREAGMKPGILINPSQRIDHIEPYIEYVDMVTLMAVEPGFAGQPLLEGSMERLREIADLRRKHHCSFILSVDGGIDYEKGKICKEIGVDAIVGTVHTVFKQPEGIKAACERFARELG